MSTNVDINERPDPDHELIKIAPSMFQMTCKEVR